MPASKHSITMWLERVPTGALPRAVTSLMVRGVGKWLYSGDRKVWGQGNAQIFMSSEFGWL